MTCLSSKRQLAHEKHRRNWGFSPVYTYESPQVGDRAVSHNSNLNGTPPGSGYLNPSGVRGRVAV